MRHFIRTIAAAFAVSTCLSVGLLAQGSGVKTGPITMTNAGSGAEMYNAYCAVCHGKSGKGDGPAAAELKKAPSDLTTISKRHEGKFPSDYVMQVLQNGPSTAKAHGSKEMPVWGPLFSALDNQAMATQRVFNLTKHLETMQQK